MENEFTDVMAKRPDSELLEIVTKRRNDFQPAAIEAAEFEIEKRNLSTEQIETAKKEIEKKESQLAEKENEPLATIQKILFFIFFWGIVPWGMAGTFKANGYLRKHKDAWKIMKYGFFTFFGFFGILILIASLTS